MCYSRFTNLIFNIFSVQSAISWVGDYADETSKFCPCHLERQVYYILSHQNLF
jgi:hypothetical protein